MNFELKEPGGRSTPRLGKPIVTDDYNYFLASLGCGFPASDPKYSIICTIFTYKTDKQYPGNDIPAKIVSEIYNNL